MSYLLKIIIAVAIIVAASELSKRSTSLAAILLAMPIVLFASFIIVWEETHDQIKIASLAYETFIFILGVIPFLFLLAYFLKNDYDFYFSLLIVSIGISISTIVLQKLFF